MGYTHGHKWTKENVQREALKYTRRIDFQKNSILAENAARRNNWLEEVCSHMEILRVRNRTKEQCREIALKYTAMIDFRINDGATHLYSIRKKWLHEITSHMPKKIMDWDDRKKEVHTAALKYQNRGEFCLKDERYYEVARKRGWLDEVCSHMVAVGNKVRRLVYVYEFEDNSVYVGLTGNDLKRSYSHKNEDTSPVYRHQKKTNLHPTKKIITDGYIDSKEAQKIEKNTVSYYKELGWNILNIASAGSLGGNDRIWTKDKIKETISKYTHLSEFRKNEKQLIAQLYSKGTYKKYIKDLINDSPVVRWDEESVKELISRYVYLNDFLKNHKGANQWLIRKNKKHLLSGLLNGNVERYVVNQWKDKDEIHMEALKYKNKTAFQKNCQSMYSAAKKNGWLDEITTHMVPKFLWTKDLLMEITKRYTNFSEFRKENKRAYDAALKYGWSDCLSHLQRNVTFWTEETAILEALKYNHRNEFIKGSAGAHHFLKNNGLLDESTKHMILKNVKGYKEPLFECSVCGEKVGGKGNLTKWHEGNCNIDRPNSKRNKRLKINGTV